MAEKEKVEAESYNKIAYDGSWRARSRGVWAVATIGLALGLAIGLAAPLIPVVAGLFIESIGAAATLQSAISVIPASMAIFGASGMATGALIGAATGETAGAASAIAKEMETRNLKRENKLAKALKTETPISEIKKPPKENVRYFNPKVGAAFTAFGAVAGAVMAAGFLASGGAASSAAIPALGTVLGPALSNNAAAVTSYFVGTMAIGGSLFGINLPKINSYMQELMGNLLSGELLGSSWEKEKGHFVGQDIKQDSQPVKKSENLDFPAIDANPGYAAKLGGPSQITSYRELIIKSSGKPQEISRA